MRKIPTVLVRDPDDRKHVLPEVTPGCDWVLAGEGIATRKYDGTCVMHDTDGWWARREVKPGKDLPPNFKIAQVDTITGKSQGWVPMDDSAFARWHAEAHQAFRDRFGSSGFGEFGTYELVGPKINGNPEGFDTHWLVPHRMAERLLWGADEKSPAELLEFARWAGERGFEGIVWHHPDGRMAKLKARDVPDA